MLCGSPRLSKLLEGNMAAPTNYFLGGIQELDASSQASRLRWHLIARWVALLNLCGA